MSIKLTQTVQKGGCAAKVAAQELRKILSQVRFPENDSQVLVDGRYFDDAAIYKIHSELALVQTLDFFTPIVDSPTWFGKIATANALSDVYAMGGTPKTALGILAFPLGQLPNEVCVEVLNGACSLLNEKKVNFVGGHSIDDDTLKFGLSVTGFVHPDKIWSNQKAQTTDLLILTKPLGTGTLTAGLKKGSYSEENILQALQSMALVNEIIPLLSEQDLEGIHAATDITGFGLLGHALHLGLGSSKTLSIQVDQIPAFELAPESITKGFLTKAHRTNKEYIKEHLPSFDFKNPWQEHLLYDPQTSGGLLLSVSESQAESILNKLRPFFPKTQIIGRVLEKGPYPLQLS